MIRLAPRLLALVAATATLGLVAVACGSDDPPFADHSDAVVRILADGCSLEPAVGAGFAIEFDGAPLILTSAHTVAGATEITARHDGADHPATLVGFDPALDVAVLAAGLTADRLGVARPQEGRPAVVLVPDADGPVARYEASVDRLIRVTIEDIYRAEIVERQAFEFQAPIEPGDSGAPVIDANGDAIGLVYARSRARDGTAFAVSGTDLRVLLRSIDPAGQVESGRCL